MKKVSITLIIVFSMTVCYSQNETKELYISKKEIKGKVKWFDSTKGIGFIQTEEGNEIFVNYTDLPAVNNRVITLQVNQIVVFDIIEGERGPQAINIKIICLL
jgi:cold shock protein